MPSASRPPSDPSTEDLTVTGALLHRSRRSSARGDLHVVGGRVAAAPAPAARRLDATGGAVVPLLREFRDDDDLLGPGARADFAVLGGRAAARPPSGTVIVPPADLRLLVLGGRVRAVDGAPAGEEETDPGWLGAWRDERTGMVQHLTADGRYSETRGGVPDAWTGRWWTDGPWIAYLDDTRFWAFGLREGDAIRHADFLLRRATE